MSKNATRRSSTEYALLSMPVAEEGQDDSNDPCNEQTFSDHDQQEHPIGTVFVALDDDDVGDTLFIPRRTSNYSNMSSVTESMVSGSIFSSDLMDKSILDSFISDWKHHNENADLVSSSSTANKCERHKQCAATTLLENVRCDLKNNCKVVKTNFGTLKENEHDDECPTDNVSHCRKNIFESFSTQDIQSALDKILKGDTTYDGTRDSMASLDTLTKMVVTGLIHDSMSLDVKTRRNPPNSLNRHVKSNEQDAFKSFTSQDIQAVLDEIMKKDSSSNGGEASRDSMVSLDALTKFALTGLARDSMTVNKNARMNDNSVHAAKKPSKPAPLARNRSGKRRGYDDDA